MTELNSDLQELAAVLERQHYCLAHWRRGDTELNYRRFFSIAMLAGLRVEDPQVFDAVHERVLDWHQRGWIDGFRSITLMDCATQKNTCGACAMRHPALGSWSKRSFKMRKNCPPVGQLPERRVTFF